MIVKLSDDLFCVSTAAKSKYELIIFSLLPPYRKINTPSEFKSKISRVIPTTHRNLFIVMNDLHCPDSIFFYNKYQLETAIEIKGRLMYLVDLRNFTIEEKENNKILTKNANYVHLDKERMVNYVINPMYEVHEINKKDYSGRTVLQETEEYNGNDVIFVNIEHKILIVKEQYLLEIID